MRDEPDFNIQFVQLVEKYPCLYDFTLPEYSNRQIQDQAWHAVATELGENVTACKDRWKNLRGGLTRHLKQKAMAGTKFKSPYYLADYLHYLVPFTKTRPKPSISQRLHDFDDYDDVFVKKENEESQQVQQLSDVEVIHSIMQVEDASNGTDLAATSNGKTRTMDTLDCTIDCFQSKRTKSDISENEDLHFFKSLLSNVGMMNPRQKNKFKIGVLNLIDDILFEPTWKCTSSSFSNVAVPSDIGISSLDHEKHHVENQNQNPQTNQIQNQSLILTVDDNQCMPGTTITSSEMGKVL